MPAADVDVDSRAVSCLINSPAISIAVTRCNIVSLRTAIGAGWSRELYSIRASNAVRFVIISDMPGGRKDHDGGDGNVASLSHVCVSVVSHDNKLCVCFCSSSSCVLMSLSYCWIRCWNSCCFFSNACVSCFNSEVKRAQVSSRSFLRSV